MLHKHEPLLQGIWGKIFPLFGFINRLYLRSFLFPREKTSWPYHKTTYIFIKHTPCRSEIQDRPIVTTGCSWAEALLCCLAALTGIWVIQQCCVSSTLWSCWVSVCTRRKKFLPPQSLFPQKCEDLEGRSKPSGSQADLVWVTLYILANKLLQTVSRPCAVQPQPLFPDVINQKNSQLLLVSAIAT